MDVVSVISGYISKMVSAGESSTGSSSSKMKILLLDSETVRVLNRYTRGNIQLIGPGSNRLYRHNPISSAES